MTLRTFGLVVLSRLPVSKNQQGLVPIEFAFGVAAILFPVGLLVLSFSPALDRVSFARQTAAELGRVTVITDGRPTAYMFRLSNQGSGSISPTDISIGLCQNPVQAMVRARSQYCPLQRGRPITITVRVKIPLIRTPFGNIGNTYYTYRHVEPVDTYRSRA